MAQRFSHKSVRVNIYPCPLVKKGGERSRQQERVWLLKQGAIYVSSLVDNIVTESVFFLTFCFNHLKFVYKNNSSEVLILQDF